MFPHNAKTTTNAGENSPAFVSKQQLSSSSRWHLGERLGLERSTVSLLGIARGLSISLLANPVATLLFYCSYRNTSNLLNIQNFCVVFITEILDFSCYFSESPSKMLRFASSAAKNLESIPNLAQPCSAFVPDLRRVVIQSHYKVDRRSRGLAV